MTAASPFEKGSASSKKLASSDALFRTVPSAEMKPFCPLTYTMDMSPPSHWARLLMLPGWRL